MITGGMRNTWRSDNPIARLGTAKEQRQLHMDETGEISFL
jgi:hypothetical protein